MRKPLEDADDYRVRMAMFWAQQNSDMKMSDSQHLPAVIDEDIDYELTQTKKATDIILLERKQMNIQERATMEGLVWASMKMVAEAVKNELADKSNKERIEMFESMGASRAIKSLTDLTTTLNKGLDLLVKEEDFVRESHNILSDLTDEELNEFQRRLEEGYIVKEYEVEEPNVTEYEDAEWEKDEDG